MDLLIRLKQFVFGEIPARQSQDEVFLSSLGAIIGVGLVTWVSHHFVGDAGLPFVVASMGAAAVLLYAAPHSQLTQPWPFVGGHLVSAIVGVTCAQWIPDLFLASALAVGLAIFVMHELSCLHPPGGAAALVAVVGGDQIHALGYLYVLVPVGLNVLIMAVAVWLTRLILAKRRKTKELTFVFDNEESKESDLSNLLPFSKDDLNKALQEINAYIDVSITDLNNIYTNATLLAHKRNLGTKACKDIMTHPVISVEFGSSLDEAWRLMQEHKIRSIPVIDKSGRISGIITVCDFITEADKYHEKSIEERLKIVTKQMGELTSIKPEVVGQLMTSPVITLQENEPVAHAFSIFKDKGIRHIPILNDEQRLVGILAYTDVIRELRVN